MNVLEKDFEKIYHTLIGTLLPQFRVPWVPNIFIEGTPYDQAYQVFWDARMQMVENYGIEFECDELEDIMNAILDVEKEIGFYMFQMGMEYEKRGHKL